MSKVWGISTEDMDALTFATPRLIRNLMAAVGQKLPINVYEYDKVMKYLLAVLSMPYLHQRLVLELINLKLLDEQLCSRYVLVPES